ncbi:MAG: hypothetical protein ACOX56_02145 [Acholeplasmataceae bacterium]
MKCLKCSEPIIENKTFKNIFEIKYSALCHKCERQLIYNYYYEVIPISSGVIHHYYLKPKMIAAEPQIDMFLLEKFFKIALFKKLPILYFDTFTDSIYEMLDTFNIGDLLIITIN